MSQLSESVARFRARLDESLLPYWVEDYLRQTGSENAAIKAWKQSVARADFPGNSTAKAMLKDARRRMVRDGVITPEKFAKPKPKPKHKPSVPTFGS